MKKSWSEITIADYRKLVEIGKRELDSELEKSISVLAVLMDKDEREMWNTNINELKPLLEDIKWIKEPYTFDKNWKSNHIMIDGQKYDVVVDINKFSVAQYADFQIYWGHRLEPEYMAKLLSCFIIPHKKKYNDGYDILELIDTLENSLSVNDYNSICFFFLRDFVYSIKASLLYSNYLMMKMPKKERQKHKDLEAQLRTLTRTII